MLRPLWIVLAALALSPARLGGQAPSGGAAPAVDPFGGVPPDALAATREYQKSGHARVVREGVFLVFPFGHEQPQLNCAPLRACNVLLNADEKILDLIAADAGQMWEIKEAQGPAGAPLVVLRPRFCDTSTNLTISTTKRLYTFSLDSPPCGKDVEDAVNRVDRDYVRFVRFYYPDELVRRVAVADSAAAARESRVVPLSPRVVDPTQLHMDYLVRRDRGFPWVPKAILDDGERTLIRLPEEALRMELPILFAVDAAGREEIVSFRFIEEAGYYEVDQVLERAFLVYGGTGGKVVRLSIERQGGRS